MKRPKRMVRRQRWPHTNSKYDAANALSEVPDGFIMADCLDDDANALGEGAPDVQ
jgi:hypothetical protein